MSFEDDISALIDRPCRADCGQVIPEDSPSDDFCSERCEHSWRAANNGCQLVRDDFYGDDVEVPAGHPAEPTHEPRRGIARSLREHVHRLLSRMWDRSIDEDMQRWEPRGILGATRIRNNYQPNTPIGLMQILRTARAELPVPPRNDFRQFLDQYGVTPRVWSQPGTVQAPTVPPSEDELRRMREQIARVFQVPPAMLEPPSPPPSVADAVGFQVITDSSIPPGCAWITPPESQIGEPVNLLGRVPHLPPGYFRAPGMPPGQAYHLLPSQGENEERRAQLVHLSIDPARPDAESITYTAVQRYDHLTDRVVFELRARVPPGALWVNVSGVARNAGLERLEGAGLEQLGDAVVEQRPEIPRYVESVRDRRAELDRLVRGEWIEEPEDMLIDLDRDQPET